MTDPAHARPPSFGFWRTWSLVTGTIVGSGVFLMPTVLAPYGGLGFAGVALAGFGILCVAITFASLAQRVTGSGGPYAYTRAAFGDFPAFLMAWMYWVSMWTGGAAIATAVPAYLEALVPVFHGSRAWSLGLTLVAIWSSVAINWLGAKEAGVVGLVVTLAKFVPLVAVGAVGMLLIDRHTLPPLSPGPLPPLAALAAAFSVAFWSYVGVESATVPAGEIIDPSRTIPRATVAGTLTAIVVYLAVTVVAMGVIPAGELAHATSPLATIGGRIAGPIGSQGVALGALLSTYACLHYTILLGGQVPLAAANDGLFPAWFARIGRRGTPGFGLVLTGVLISAVIVMTYTKGLVAAYTFILLIGTLATVVPYAFCAMAELVVPQPVSCGRGARIRAGVVAALAFLASFAAVAGAGVEAVYWSMLLLLGGLPLYTLIRRVAPRVTPPVR